MMTRILRWTFLVFLLGVPLSADSLDFPAQAFDLKAIIAERRFYDNSIISVSGDFVIERHRGSEIEKVAVEGFQGYLLINETEVKTDVE